MATKFTFQLQRNKQLPEQLIPFMRVCYCTSEEQLKQLDLHHTGEVTESDVPILQHLVLFLQQRLARCVAADAMHASMFHRGRRVPVCALRAGGRCGAVADSWLRRCCLCRRAEALVCARCAVLVCM